MGVQNTTGRRRPYPCSVQCAQEWRHENLGMPFKEDFANPVEYAIQSLLHFDDLILRRKPDLIYRIEDQSQLLVDMVRRDRMYRKRRHRDPGVMNRRAHRGADSLREEYADVRPEYREMINNYCDHYGYDRVFPLT